MKCKNCNIENDKTNKTCTSCGQELKKTNAFSILGIIFAIFFFPVGLIFSIIGLVKSKTLGTGKKLSIAGIIVSSIVGVASLVFAMIILSYVLTFGTFAYGFFDYASNDCYPGLCDDLFDYEDDDEIDYYDDVFDYNQYAK